MKECCAIPAAAQAIMNRRFGKDMLIALATQEGDWPHVRTVDAYYLDGAFYVVTHALSGKMRQMKSNPHIAVCGEWFTGHGVGENLGWVRAKENAALMDTLRGVFSAWYTCGHVDEKDENTCLLRIRLTHGVLMSEGVRYEWGEAPIRDG